MVTKACPICGKPFTIKRSSARKRFRCSRECYSAARKRKSLERWANGRGSKFCKICDQTKPGSEFGPAAAHVDGLAAYCRKCTADLRRSALWRYKTLLRRAKKYGHEVELSLEYHTALTANPCRYCGGFTAGMDHVGVDRVDNSKGYTIENSAPCCRACNLMKGAQSLEEWAERMRTILARMNW